MTHSYDQRAEHARWIAQSNVDFFGTLKFRNGYDLSPERAEQAVRYYWNKVDRAICGNAKAKLGMRVERFVFRHVGTSGYNDHYHFAARSVGSIDLFCHRLLLLWGELDEADPASSRIEPIRSKVGAARYLTHEFRQLSDETFQPALSHTGPSLLTPNAR